MRAAMLGVSPIAHRSDLSGPPKEPTTTRPLWMPTRTRRSNLIEFGEFSDSLHHFKPALDGAGGVVLVRDRVTEVDLDVVTSILRYEPADLIYDDFAHVLIGSERDPQVFRV